MKMEPHNTHEVRSPETDDFNVATLATDSNNDHASLSIEGGERSVSGDDRSIEAISPYVLEWENDEDEEIKETISHDDNDGLDHSGDESGREGSGSPPALGNARTSNADETIGRPLSSALVPYVHFHDRHEDDSDEDLARTSRFEREPRPYESSLKYPRNRSRESSNDSSESEPLDDRFRRQPAPYGGPRPRPSAGPKRWVRWDDAEDTRNYYSDSSSSSVAIRRREASDRRYDRQRERERFEEEEELMRERRKLARMRSLQELRERQRARSTSDTDYSSDSHIDIHVSRRRREIPSRLQSPVRYVGDSRSRIRGRSHRRGYVPPISADRDDNDAQLAETLPFDLKDEKLIEDARRSTGNTGSTLQAWFKKRASFGDGIDTELVVINAAESFTDEKAKSIVTLYCQKDALDHVEPTPRQIYWLHMRHSSDVLKVIRSLVICCPFIHTGYQSLALGLLERVSPHDQNFSRNATLSDQEARTNVSRVDGVHAGHPLLRDSVTYYSTPYLVFREGQRKMGHDDMESLLSAHYGYDVGDARDKMQVLSETQKWLDKEILHVARMKGLLIGPEVLLTWGEVPLSAICKDNIIFDESNSRPLVTVRITDFHSKEYYSYIKHNFSFAELIARITNLTSLEDFDIIEDTYDGAQVNSELWATMLKEALVTFDDIRLSLWRKAPRHYLRDSEYFAPPPPPPPPPPDFDRSRVVHIDYNNRSTSRTQIQRHKYAPETPVSDGHAPRGALMRRPGTPHTYAGPESELDRHRNRAPSIHALSEPAHRIRIIQRRRSESFSSSRSGSTPPPSMSTTVVERYHEAVPSTSHTETTRRRHTCLKHRFDSPNRSETGTCDTAIENIQSAKIVNDKSIRKKKSRTYHLSSSGSESDDKTPSPKPSSIASRSSFVRTRSRERSIRREPAEPFDTPATPFLMWKVTQGSGGEQKEEGSMSTMVRLLRKIDGSLRESILYGRVYKSGYECSLEDICDRHDILSDLGSESATVKATTEDSTEESDEGSASKKSTENPSPDSSRSTGDSEKKQGGLYVNTTEQANQLTRDVFKISKTILGLYLPLKDDGARFYADIKGVIDRFWGALDLIFRHIRFAALMTAAEGEQSWIIRGSCYNHAKSPVDGTCDSCESKKEYDLIGALEHLHARSGHTQSPDHQVPAAPHEDPCIVWLQNSKTAERDRLFNTLIEDLTVFKGDLGRILDVSRELHLFIARPGNRPEEGFNEHVGNRGTANEKEGAPGIGRETREKANDHSGSPHEARGDQQTQEQKRSINQTEAPALPTSLLRAFENIVALFSVQARIVLLTSRENESKGRRNNRVYKGKTRYISTLDEVITCIESAREDLILGITAENTSSVRLGAVGAEYIVAMAMANVQTGAFRIGAGSSKVPLSFAGFGGEVRRGTRRRAVTWTEDLEVPDAVSQRPGHKVAAPTTSLDLIALYAAHARALDFNASLRPKRRAFLAIRALEEELQALKDLNVTQWHCLDNSKRVSDPISFRVVDRERKARFPLERKVIERAKAERRREHDELIAMLHRAADLRARVKESIEVLDEGHGNAIRVFTLVTLFFLPLSFVTSFFGMNTVDIRDMPQSSWMYWATAAPITLLVLCSAYLYAYKWETITRRVTRRTWLDEGVSHSREPHASRAIDSWESYMPRRLGGRRRTRRSTLGDYSNGGWRDTWGLRKGETIADVA